MPRRGHVRHVSVAPAPGAKSPKEEPLDWSRACVLFLNEERLKGRRPRTLVLHKEVLAASRADLDAIGAPAAPAG